MVPVTLLLVLLLPSFSHGDYNPQLPNPSYSSCPFPGASGNYTSNSTFETNLNTLLANLSSSTPSSSGFLTSSSGSIPDRVFGLSLCRGDATPSKCSSCLDFAASDLPQLCPYYKTAVIWYDHCLLRYSNTRFATSMDNVNKFYLRNTKNVSLGDLPRFNQSILWVLDKLRDYAVNSAKSPELFAAGRMDLVEIQGYATMYGMVQCTRDITAGDCDQCLRGIFKDLPDCCSGGAIGGRVLAPTCSFRYETGPFYNWSQELSLPPVGAAAPISPPPIPVDGWINGTNSAGSGKKKNGAGTIIAVAIPVTIAAVLFLVLGCLCFRKKLTKTKSYDKLEDIMTIESLLFDLATIRRATNNFSPSNKLGEGGFGSVYKGVLPDGQEIAVKRITNGSVQGLAQLKNEVVLLAKLQHRNLVRILGVCFEEHERMLIYEFVANKSIDTILFDPERKEVLDWETRYKIITGVARGLQYLHEESQITIVHRDLKASNVLLDAELNPKIADFGTAKLFGGDQTQLCTNTIVGTFGYMPPEYAIRGRFSIKSDVFSFGLLVLEIVTGCKNSDFFNTNSDDSGDLLSFVWYHWSNGSISEIVDPSLREKYSRHEVERCIQIGLLCVQEFPNDRPAMSSIVLMLNSHSVSVHVPIQPSFLNSYARMGPASQKTSSSGQSTTKSEAITPHEASNSELEAR